MGLFPMDDPEYSAVYAEEAAMVDASEIIAEAIQASGVSQAALARALKVSRSEITERLRGDRNITVRNLAATLHAVGAELELGVRLPASARPDVREPVDIDAYRRWTMPAAREHHQHLSSYARYAVGGRR